MTNIDPFILFKEWFEEANSNKKIKQANAMNLATSTASGFPSSRIVLLKDFSSDGFIFYTNLDSRKGKELQANPRVALCFYWEPLDKQIRIEGNTKQVSDEDADNYFNSRPINSRIGAQYSRQSETMKISINELRDLVQKDVDENPSEIKRPKNWSGFRVVPTRIEFWQDGGISRLHDRKLFIRSDINSKWEIKNLYP